MENNVIKTYEDIVVKNVNCGKYKEKRDMLNLIKYITGNSTKPEKQKSVRYIGGCGVPYYNSDLCCDSMYIVKKYYNKTDKKFRSVYHFMISFENPIEDANIVKLIAIGICQNFYEDGFQCIYGVHEDTEHLHIHIAVNGTNFTTGKQMHLSNSELKALMIDLKKRAYGILKEKGY